MSEGKIHSVLFVCTGNSARSIMAESLLNHLGHGRFKAYSAGSHPTGRVNPLALSTLENLRIPAQECRSKSWDEFARAGAPAVDFVLTVCDKAAGEICPVWPGQPITAQWGVPDPAVVEGSDEEKARAFMTAASILKRRIDLMLLIPMFRLDNPALPGEIIRIGKS